MSVPVTPFRSTRNRRILKHRSGLSIKNSSTKPQQNVAIYNGTSFEVALLNSLLLFRKYSVK